MLKDIPSYEIITAKYAADINALQKDKVELTKVSLLSVGATIGEIIIE